MSLPAFNGADPAPIITALQAGDWPGGDVVSVMFHLEAPGPLSLNEQDQWLRLKMILGREPVYDALGISSLPIDVPGQFHHADGLETIGTLANLLRRASHKYDCNLAMTLSRNFLDRATVSNCHHAEAYSCHDPWCQAFFRDDLFTETVLLGIRDDWWLLVVTGTD